MRRGRLHVLGASGSGATTLGRVLASYWSVPHADADDYFWVPSDPPYVEKRPDADRTALMQELFVPREAWVLSGSMMGWGEDVVAQCDAVVFLRLDPEERLRRLHAREELRQEGRTFDPVAWQEFVTWASGYDDPEFDGRSLRAHEAWLTGVGKPVLTLDSAAGPTVLRDAVLAWEPDL
ncbi:MAG TPA: AAA family ATPase [Nocardioides sp.]|nr:AAA family ATPase [Nocardioides sp.]